MRRQALSLVPTLIAIAGLLLSGCTPAADDPGAIAPAENPSDAEGVVVEDGAPTPDAQGIEPSPQADGTAGDDAASAGGAAKMSLTASFTSTELGVAIDHPEDWRVEDNGSMIMLKSYPEDTGPGTDGVPAHLTKIDILALPGFPLDMDARVAQIKDELSSIAEEEEITLINGERAVWLRGEGGMAGDTGIIVTIVGNELYQLQAYGNPEPLKAVGFTFRAVE